MKLYLLASVMLWHCFSFATLSVEETKIYQNLFNAVAQNNISKFQKALNKTTAMSPEKVKELMNHYDSRLKFTLLQRCIALENPDFEIFSSLLINGANPHVGLSRNIRNQLFKGYTTLHIACRRQKDMRFFETLALYNINFKGEDDEGWSPFAIALSEGNLELIKWLAPKSDLRNAVLRKAPNKNSSYYDALLNEADLKLKYDDFNDEYFQLMLLE